MINLLVPYYIDNNQIRQKEIDLCLFQNLNNQFMNTIIIQSQERLKFSFLFDKINSFTNTNDINMICNSDIYFDDSVKLAEKMTAEESYALTRWDIDNGVAKFYDHSDSQDAWIFRGKIKDSIFADFYLGHIGCDNRLAAEIKKCGYKLSNPSKSIKTYHVHNSGVRNYVRNKDFTVSPPYLQVHPTELR